MVGITSYGGYIPRLRLKRSAILQAMGWFAPAIVAVAQGTRSVCNWDEDALSMAVEASRDCLVGLDKTEVDGLFLASTTMPYADRQNAGIVQTALNLGREMNTADFGGSLRAGTAAMIAALDSVKSGERSKVLVSASDSRQTRGAYFYEMWFGDGAASLTFGRENVIARFLGSHSISCDFVDHYRGRQNDYDYMWEERWVRDEGYSKLIPEAIEGLLTKLDVTIDAFRHVVYPCFFDREHQNIARKLKTAKGQVHTNLHGECGETGAAHPLVMLVRALEKAEPGDKILVASFGQGCDVLAFEATEAIKSLPARRGINGSLAQGKELDNYEKYLKFRDLISVEMGIRAEVGGQIAMTTLWRNRKMILGLVGNRCGECGTPQFPPLETCVKPDCGCSTKMSDYEFAERKGRILMYTGDMLAVSQEPPSMYGMIEFEGGGRFLCDFTDCDLSQLKVGQTMRMTFRKRWTDSERGYHGYFWKAVPQAN
ncbi:MAG: hydroxymethylglutaryl-CoA synthase family protein [Myxococcales bacterium]|nr:hydroxymethylglutaryl-CoA synthase family protein [Myxococcales bacterium]